MGRRLRFDSTNNVLPPTLVLANRNGKKIGAIPARNISFKNPMNSYSELFFKVYKYEDTTKYKDWDYLKDFKLVWYREMDIWYEINVELDESNELIKNVSAKSLGESELSQIRLHNVEINTEADIERLDYSPTVIYNEDNKSASLLHRIMEKAPHYKIAHVDISIANIQRTFQFNGTTIYDAFHEIGEEINCIFIINSGSDTDGKIDRSISVYDMECFCLECGKREENMSICPDCGSSNISRGYGKDTGIFVSTENLADNITYSTDVGSVKNCFHLIAGDDLMTATVANCNPNGSPYIWYISSDVKEDMSAGLVSKLNEYDQRYDYYQKDYTSTIPIELVSQYNTLVDKYFHFSDSLSKIDESITGYPMLMETYYNTIDFYLFLNSGLMPNVEIQDSTAASEGAKLTADNLSPVAVQDLSKCSAATASSAVLAMAKIIVDSRYQVKVDESTYEDNVWNGSFIITNYSNEEDTCTTENISVVINDDYESFVRQKLEKALDKNNGGTYDAISLFALDDENFISELKKYSLVRLTSFHDSCQACLNILIEQGIADRETWETQNQDLYSEIYLPYYNKLGYISEEIKVRENELAIVGGLYDNEGMLVSEGVQTVIEKERNLIQNELNFEAFLGDDLWFEFIAYRREDDYQNDNYISDGLDTSSLFKNALEFIETAKKDIYKSATLQHSISATLKNLLVMKEFEPIVDHFELGNWIRVKVDGSVYKLRLIDYEINFDDLSKLPITFSDVISVGDSASDIESVLNKASSMSSSYSSVSRQAGQGKKSSEKLDDWVTKGLALTTMKIVDSAENQNVTFDSNGLLCKEYLPITDTYDDKQLKLINRGIYLTDDNWLTSRAGIGDFTFYNPQTGQMEETYGVIADTLVGNLILSEKVGIYNTNNSITLDENGLIITSDHTEDTSVRKNFTIEKKTLDSSGNEILTQMMYIDSDGNLVLNGSIRINASTDSSLNSLDDLADSSRLSDQIAETVHNEAQNIYDELDSKYNDIISETTSQIETFITDIGQYLSYDENGLLLGASSSNFKTVIDNQGMYFKEGDYIVSYIRNNQLNIPNAVIEYTLTIGNFIFTPRRADGGVSVIWQE